jgi:hypothetical protein
MAHVTPKLGVGQGVGGEPKGEPDVNGAEH